MKNYITNYSLRLVKEKESFYDSSIKVDKPQAAIDILKTILNLDDMPEEYMYLLALDTAGSLIGLSEISKGGNSQAYVDKKSIAKRLLLLNASKFILAHNHPSGNLCPSDNDINVANACVELGKILDIDLLDFLILGKGFISFREEDLLC